MKILKNITQINVHTDISYLVKLDIRLLEFSFRVTILSSSNQLKF